VYIGDIVDVIQEGIKKVTSTEEFEELEICQLYEVVNGVEVYAVLDINDKDVMEMLWPFAVMMSDHKTVISQKIWDCHVQKHSVLSLPEVATKIWTPVFIEIQQLIGKFYDKSVTLKEIIYYLKNISPQELQEEITRLVKGYNWCLDKSMSYAWIPEFVESVSNYNDACEAQSAAKLILTAKDALMLTGNFQELEQFKSEVFSSSSK